MRALLAALLVVATAVPASAQRPHGPPPGLAKKGAPGAAPSGADVPAGGGDPGFATGRVRALGAWLDDATLISPGESWLSLSFQRWASPVAAGVQAPVADVVAGVTPRLHVFGSLPYSRYGFTGEPWAGEIGDLYVGGKYVLAEPDAGQMGFAVSPTLEILSETTASVSGGRRLHAVLPVSFEARPAWGRVYGSGGWFTRGAFFLGGAVERPIGDRWYVTGALTRAWSTDDEALDEEIGLGRGRTDATGSVAVVLTPELMIFGSLSRTLSSLDADATKYAIGGGVSLNLYRPGRRTPVRRP